MAESSPSRRTAQWVTAGLLVCFILAVLRVGIPIYRRQRALAALDRIGCKVVWSGSWTPDWVRTYLFYGSRSPFDRIDEIFLPNREHQARPSREETRALLGHLAEFGELQRVDFYDTVVDGADVRLLECLRHLRCLWITVEPCNDDAVKSIARHSDLIELALGGSEIDDAAIANLAPLTKLEVLALNRTGISNAGLQHLSKLPRLRELSICNTAVTDAGIEELLKTHPDLLVIDD